MAVRVKLKIRCKLSDKELETSALVNTGFETATPQLLLPVEAARALGLYPLPPEARSISLGTAGGPTVMFSIPRCLEVWVVTPDRSVGSCEADALIALAEEEVLINDKLSEALGLILLAVGSGRWRFTDDPPNRVRSSEAPQYWR